ncbi:hypothetical protein [Desulfurococcus amylolyticus]|uniref:Uncharacterized protein n=1 Tax=Desulfurococcus amylolyticus (strain DSM 18924 / JCM 16383 / VKM B-2413 / 1221n) TaxID=490899 RepID=B8D3G2_DESA1|nr:hypothetical protein [Desulfurococcus amylolyticus]ACL10643.1 hypothetical protein DKAM_0317 [Desulfurococcus amylolyticus 1221n]
MGYFSPEPKRRKADFFDIQQAVRITVLMLTSGAKERHVFVKAFSNPYLGKQLNLARYL